jgi:hypothetical protein
MPELKKEDSGIYQYGQILVAPYPVEKLLINGFLRFQDEKTLPLIFHEGPEPTLAWILNEFCTKMTAILACFSVANGIDKAEHIGFSWMNNLVPVGKSGGKKMEVGHGYFRHTPPRQTLIAAALCTEWIFDKVTGLEMLCGCTPEKNRAALRFVKALGWQVYGPLDGYTCYPDGDGNYPTCAAYISGVTRKHWQEVRERHLKP